MHKSTRFALLFVFVLAFAITANSQDPPKQKADWRKAAPTLDFMASHLPGDDEDFYEFPVVDLLSEFGRRGEVSVRYDARQVSALPKLSMRGQKEPGKLILFEMCQRALESNGLTLLPEPGNARAFSVQPDYASSERAPLVKAEEIAGLAPSEWAALVYTLKSPNASAVVSMAQGVAGQRGGKIQASTSEPVLLIVDRAANLSRILEVLASVDKPRADPNVVPYQRASSVPLYDVAKTLQAFLDRYAEHINVRKELFHVNYDRDSRMLLGMIPQALASFLDAAVDGAEKAAGSAQAEREMSGPNYVTFELAVPPTHKVVTIEASLRKLFEPELAVGDLRTYLKGDPSTSIVIRCRKWLQPGIEDAFAVFLK